MITAFACSTTQEDNTTGDDALNVDALSQEELARKALQIMGAAQPPPERGNQSSCTNAGCHNINRVTLQQWKRQYDAAMAKLSEERDKRTIRQIAKPAARAVLAPTSGEQNEY